MKRLLVASPAQARQTKQEFADPGAYLDYELGKAVQKLPPLYTRLVALSLSFTVFGAIAWAALSKVDEVAVADGKLIPGEQDVEPVRSRSSGPIKYINETKVKEGQQVEKGELLIALDSKALEFDIETLHKQARLLRQEIMRVRKAADESQTARLQEAEIESSRLLIQLNSDKRKADKECPFFSVYREKCKDAQDQLNISRKLFEAQKPKIKQLNEDYKTGPLSEVSKLSEELNSVKGKIIQDINQLQNQNILAPIAGTVYNIKVNPSQDAVQSGEELLSILPVGKEPVLEVDLPAQYQGFVHEKMRAKVKVNTFPYQEFGTIDGEVIYISPYAISRDNSGKQVFPTRIELKTNFLRVGNGYKMITPGMLATGEIVIREKSILSLLLDPITRQVDDVFSRK